jgi:outer membrane protein OmpA-like peptidoglycan-associated protein
MSRSAAVLLLTALLGCATDRGAETAPPPGPGSILHAAELARVRCLLVAPFENGSDAPLAAEAATGAILAGVDSGRTRVFPVAELRGLFRDTPLELPQGVSPSLALELAELVGADAALWGSVAGRSREGGELLVELRLSLVGDHRLLFAETTVVTLGPRDRSDAAVRKAVLRAARPMLGRLGDPGRKRCFDPERTRALRKLALAEAAEAKPVAAVAAPRAAPATPPARPPAATAPAAPPAPAPRAESVEPRTTARQTEWALKLERGERLLLDDVAFSGRTAALQRDVGLADLGAALFAQPAVRVRLEAFVDATSDRAADLKLSTAMAEAAGKRLVDLGVPRHRVAWGGRGGDSPILPNFTSRGRAANRRLEVVVVP